MVAFGHIENGVVVLDNGATLPEGSRVSVAVLPADQARPQSPDVADATQSRPLPVRIHTATVQRSVVLPIFPYDGTPDIDLTNERIAEILGRDDVSA